MVVAIRLERGYWDAKPDPSPTIRPELYDANSGKTPMSKKFVTLHHAETVVIEGKSYRMKEQIETP
jgi:hypothetical protein